MLKHAQILNFQLWRPCATQRFDHFHNIITHNTILTLRTWHIKLVSCITILKIIFYVRAAVVCNWFFDQQAPKKKTKKILNQKFWKFFQIPVRFSKKGKRCDRCTCSVTSIARVVRAWFFAPPKSENWRKIRILKKEKKNKKKSPETMNWNSIWPAAILELCSKRLKW